MQEVREGSWEENRQWTEDLEHQIRTMAFSSREGGATEGSGGNRGGQYSHFGML